MKQEAYTLTSGFGPRWGAHHSGLDFGAPDGTPFYACAGGTVQFIGAASGYGQWIVIDHPESEGGGCTEYGHMWDASATGLAPGDWVDAGQLIGYVGSNGQSTGPHLHLTVWQSGYGSQRIDPEVWLQGCPHPSEGATPVSAPGTIFGVDVSEHQDGMSLKQARDEGMEFAILRLCDGTHADTAFRSHLADAESAGLLVSAYWYLRAPSEGTSIAQQVDVIDVQMGGRRDISVWIDVESVGPEPEYRKLLTGEDVWEAKRELERRGYHVPGVYSGRWYWEYMPGGEPSMDGLGALWCSNYGGDRDGTPSEIYQADGGDAHNGWKYPLGDRRPDILQFSSKADVAGFAEVDVNAFRGSRDQLAALFNITESETDMNLFQSIADFIKGFVGPIGLDVKAIRRELTGGRDEGQYPGFTAAYLLKSIRAKGYDHLTLVDMIALLIWGTDADRAAARKIGEGVQ
ncbi:peptidoglycan DD-metalloendopeptidase family protein [Corynebacterium sp. H127]|uniref:peptidoglycan DD-metalloendopeptidase family protein n=1 Tax=Corynebacterium sp. H127 TaxID=3133418 RepID=UPI003098E609